MTDISFITTCKGRLAHLKRTLPTWIRQPGAEVVVVDYSCPDESGAWVEANHAGAKVVRCENEPMFRIARARNLGSAVAQGTWLCFIDADVLLADDFVAQVTPMLDETSFVMAEQGATSDLLGTAVIPRSAFTAAGGYDEAMEGWGGEDHELYLRLESRGLTKRRFPANVMSAIAHDDAMRVRHVRIHDKVLGWNVNRLYIEAKAATRKLTQQDPDLETRRALYEQVRSAVVTGARRKIVQLHLPLGSAANVTRADVRQTLLLELHYPSPQARDTALRRALRRVRSGLRKLLGVAGRADPSIKPGD